MDLPLIDGYYLDGHHDGGVYNSFNLAAYAYCRQNPTFYIDPNGKQYNNSILLEPVKVTKTYIDEFDKEYKFITTDGYRFTKAAGHLLSLVSGVDEKDILNAKIYFSTIRSSGASITTGASPSEAKIIHYYEKNIAYKATAGNYFFQFLARNVHEVGHIPQLKNGYLAHIATSLGEYAKNIITGQDWHDGTYSTKEPLADIGENVFKNFNKFINDNYGKNKLEQLFKNSSNTQKDIIDRLDQWWKAYKKETP